MDYEPKIIPEGINTRKEHPLREFSVLFLGLTIFIALVTGLLAFSADTLIQYIPVEKENQWFSNKILLNNQIDNPASSNPLVSEVDSQLQRIIEELRPKDEPDYQFSIGLIDSNIPIAFIIPGGHIFVTSALLKHVESENGLAMVLAHEMGHQYHRHPIRGLGRMIVISLALIVISRTESDSLVQNFVSNAAILTSLKFSREQEREADSLGIKLLISRYGHAGGSSEFFDAMKRQQDMDSELPQFLSSHPGVDERISMLQNHSLLIAREKTSLPDVIVRYLQ